MKPTASQLLNRGMTAKPSKPAYGKGGRFGGSPGPLRERPTPMPPQPSAGQSLGEGMSNDMPRYARGTKPDLEDAGEVGEDNEQAEAKKSKPKAPAKKPGKPKFSDFAKGRK